MPGLSIIIVNYNTRDSLRRTLDSIERERGELDVETIVVDNASKDGSADMVRGYPNVKLIEPGQNTWFTGGNNLGLSHATREYALILNPDIIVQSGALHTMVDYLSANQKVGAVSCQMRGLDGSLQRTCSRVPRFSDLLVGYTFLGVLLPFWRANRRAEMWYDGWNRDTTRAVEVIPGSCILASRELLNRLTLFDESLRLYFPEDDFCKRLLDAGYEVHFMSDALLLHEEHVSIRLVQRLASQIYFDDLLVFTKKWYGFPAALLLRLLIIPTRLAMNVAQRLRGEKSGI